MKLDTYTYRLLVVYIIIVVVISLFPPFVGKKTSRDGEKFIGMHFMFSSIIKYSSDRQQTVSSYRTVDGEKVLTEEKTYYPKHSYASTRVDIGRLLCELVAVSAIFGWLVLRGVRQRINDEQTRRVA
ncbi:hypothetical protein STSP2_00973 [Anaerohalosphaera lusitana]|uniref:Uncharacterized protein n=1 Tax=Anaerohalosphaera lusitana TaxID=1936003 RepID=A0A1U9NIR7_9BACT|nr:hypothetical protein [Anaerohalosphaera lusitana]AQT67823.1 hypothetical protein STSP2_00973 [Anaerohalosphaera lusitana]